MRWADLGDRPRLRGAAGWALRLALAVPVTYHGLWNLSAEGASWWAGAGLPAALRLAVGAGELLAVVAVLSGVLSRVAAGALVLIFAGAIPEHAANGFSFKHGGYEPLLVYALLALAIVLAPRVSPKGVTS